MEQNKLFKGRDKRQKGWFWMDNDYLNGYAKYFGAIGTAIYISLCRHANNETQECFPAQEKIAEELNIGARTVRKYINIFRKYHLIEIKRERNNKTKKWKNNVYTLLDKRYWNKPEATDARGKPEANNYKTQRQITTESQRQQMPHKETHIYNKTYINKTHTKDVVNYFFELKDWANKEKGFYKKNKIIYSRFTKPAKDLLDLCDNDLDEAKYCMKKVCDWAESRDLSWSMETIFKRWYDIDGLEPQEKKPYYNGYRIFQKTEGGKWYIVKPDGIKELGIYPSKEKIKYK